MRTFVEYLFYFRTNPKYDQLIELLDNDPALPINETDHNKALMYFASNNRYEALSPQIAYLHKRYVANLDPTKRVLL